MVSLEIKFEVQERIVAKIAEVELHLQKDPEPSNLFVDGFRFETNLEVLVLENGPFSFKVGSYISAMALVLA